ncbi:MAG: Ig-like domain-containing protein, partial [Anaerolineae bacterium]|nr:Ig-like domain-containing protein [Anaerolineae bacterium]
NHSSSDSVYFDRYSRWTGGSLPNVFPTSTTLGLDDDSGACETNSGSFTPWYTFFNYTGGGASPCSDNRDYPKWFGIFDSLPVYNHDYGPVRDYFINNGVNSVGPYWISQGASGWRLDVAPEIDHGTINDPTDDYWEDFRAAVHAIAPDAYIVGEEWGNPTSWTIGGEWDATMNYQFSAAVLSFWRDTALSDNDFNGGSSAGVLNPLDANGVNERLLNLEERYAPPAFYAMMNNNGSHDTNRVLFLLDHNTGSNNPATYNNPAYDWSDAISRLRGAALMQMTMPGAPTIYYGDEIGLVGPIGFDGSQWQDDPYNRQPYPWLDETGTPFYNHLQSTTSRDALYNYYALLTSTRNSNPALRTGSFDPLYTSGDIYAYGRKMSNDSNTAIVVINGTNSVQSATVNVSGYIPFGANLTDALTSTAYIVDGSGNINIPSLPARGGVILILNSFTGRPACVTDLVAVGGAGNVNLSWSTVANATSYDVYRSRLSGGGFDFIGNVGTNSYLDGSVANATTYYYRVVGRNDATGLTSDLYCNNEASATPALAIGWHTLQWPPTLTHTLSAVTPTANIYGQVYIGGSTDAQNTPVAGVSVEVGYGPVSTNPNSPSWTWFPAIPNPGYDFNQNNDEYQGTLLPTAAGTFWYTYRWSTDGGLTWRYSQLNPPGGDYTSGNVGVLTVNPPADTTAPAAPTTLAVLATTSTSVTLGWDAHPNTDGDLYGFRVYRENTASPGYTLINTVIGAGVVQYIDNSVTSGENYNYYITALDDSLNESAQSNVVNADAVLRQVAVTFVATVPNPSPGTIHIVGSFNGWNPGDPTYAMTQTGPTTWEITFDILDGTTIEYKYSRGDWLRGDKAADGNAEISNRMHTANYGVTGVQTVNNTVANWRDPLVVSTNPADTATGVPPGSTLDIVWNQDMPTNLNSCVTITGPSGAVTGGWAFDGTSNTSTFTPSANLEIGTHTVAIAGCVDIAGDVQQVPYNYSFDVGLPAGMVAVTFSTTVPSHTPTDVYLVGGFGSAGYPNWDPAGILMTQVSPTLWETTLILPDTVYFEYKYTRNDWSNEERDADGYSGGGNRNFTVTDGGGQTQTVTDTVGNWRDPYVISVTPADASINNPPNTVVTITWNKDMPAITGFTLADSIPANVTGTIGTGTNTHTFTPDAVLPDDTYDVAVSGNTDNAGNAQQVPFASSFSVSAIAGVNVTFSVTVPSHTPGTVHLIGTFASVGGSDWTHMPMTNVGGDVWELTFNAVPVGTNFEYKYTRGSWETVEKEADGNAEILSGANRTYVVPATPAIADTVANWRDPYVISSIPADGATFNDGNIPTITFTWNQDMPASLPNNAPTGVFTVLDSALNPVAGVLTYDSGTDTHTFTVDAGALPLPNETYTVTLSGNNDVAGDTQQIVSSFSFTVTSVLYDLNDGGSTWYNLQWPPTIAHTLSAVTPTATIYGQIWINGVTGSQNGVDPTPGLLAEVGYGPDGTPPNDPAWVWTTATFNVNVGNNDEFMGTLLPTAVGDYDYLYRYSGDGGATWYYGTNTGPFRDLTFASYNPANAGQLTVTAPTDTTAPDAPTGLSVIGVSDTQIELGWVAHPNTDGDLFAFEVYRDGVLIDTITDPLATSYIDTTVVTGTTYDYYIVAVDTSFNASAPSNTVTATASTTVVVVTPPVEPPVNPPGN